MGEAARGNTPPGIFSTPPKDLGGRRAVGRDCVPAEAWGRGCWRASHTKVWGAPGRDHMLANCNQLAGVGVSRRQPSPAPAVPHLLGEGREKGWCYADVTPLLAAPPPEIPGYRAVSLYNKTTTFL